MMLVESHRAVDEELAETALYIEHEREGYGERFLSAYRETIELIRRHPDAGSPRQRRVRRMRIKGFTYDIVYQILGDVIYVAAVAHHRRRPSYLRARLR